MKIHELKARLAVATQNCEEFLRSHEKDGVINEEDKKVYDVMLETAKNIKAAIDREEELEVLNKSLAQPTSAPIVTNPADSKKAADPKKKDYMDLFMDYVRGNLTHSQVVNALEVGTDSEGGYLVPDEFERKLIEKLNDLNVVRGLATTITTASGTRLIPVVTTNGSAAWVDEEGSYTESDEAFGQVTLGAFKAGTLIKVSDELLHDSAFDLESYIINAFAQRIANLEEQGFCVGDGSGKPTGIFTANGGAVGVTAESTTEITADEIIDLVYSLKAPYRKNAKFLCNEAVVKKLRKLKDGNGQYLWQPGLVSGQPDRLVGYEVVTSAYAPTPAASAYTVAFGDFSYYWIADREAFQVKKLEELYAANGQVGFRGSHRVDGKIILTEAIKLIQQAAS